LDSDKTVFGSRPDAFLVAARRLLVSDKAVFGQRPTALGKRQDDFLSSGQTAFW
jgi:hypothetical protein